MSNSPASQKIDTAPEVTAACGRFDPLVFDQGGDGARQMMRLMAIMEALRDPDHGCPWDIEQDFASIAPYTIEEAYEVADAIARGEMGELEG